MHPDPLGPPVDVRHLLGRERRQLLALLDELTDEDWHRPTACPCWTVHELVVHLVHDDMRRLSGQRDGHKGVWVAAASLEQLTGAIDDLNNRWVTTALPSRKPGTRVELRVRDPFQRSWTFQASITGWTFTDPSNSPDASVDVPAAALWRRAVRTSSRQDIAREARVHGDPQLADAILDLRAAIVADNRHPEETR